MTDIVDQDRKTNLDSKNVQRTKHFEKISDETR